MRIVKDRDIYVDVVEKGMLRAQSCFNDALRLHQLIAGRRL